jgi:hypothetical protein
MRETRRVLVDGGLFAFSAWDRLEANPHAQSVTDTIARLFPGDPVADFTRVPYGFNDAARIGELLAASGFVDARFETVRAEVQSPSARSLAIGLVKGTPRALLLQERGASLDAVVDSVAAALVKVGGDGPYRSPAQALVVTARAA